MKKTFLSIFLTLTISSFAQKQLIEELKIDSSTKIIGRYRHYDKNQTYKDFNFILENPMDMQEAISLLTYGKEYTNTVEDPDFRIEIIQNFKEIKSYTINPKQSSVRFEGHTYAFDLSQLKILADKHPFNYNFEKVVFHTKEDYLKYVEEQKKNPNYLFDYQPQFKYKGSFEIEFPRNSKFSSPKAISDYANPIIEKIATKDEYSISYVLNEKNRKNQSQFTMTIRGPKKIFDLLKVDELKNANWENTVEYGHFFFKNN